MMHSNAQLRDNGLHRDDADHQRDDDMRIKKRITPTLFQSPALEETFEALTVLKMKPVTLVTKYLR